MNEESVIEKYFATVTGKTDGLQIHGVTTADLPRYVHGLYEMRDAVMLGRPIAFAILRGPTLPSVVELARHYEMLKGRLSKEVIFVGDMLTTRAAERLVRRGIPHIVPGKQLFLPFLLMDVKFSGTDTKEAVRPEATKLGPWSEALLIRQLVRKDLHGLSGAEISQKTGMSPMTTQRAITQLYSANLCRMDEQGRKKILHFDSVQILWEKASQILLPPLAMTLSLDEIPKGLPTYIAGVSALAKSTLLADDKTPVLATSRRIYAHVSPACQVPPEDAKFRLELWDRDPGLTAENGVVDPISLYLNMRHGDDRVRIALLDLLRRYDLGESS